MKKLFLMFILLCTTVIGAFAETPSTENEFYIAGGFNEWRITDAIKLVKQANGTYTATVNGFSQTSDGFQVVKNKNWDGQYGNTDVVPKNQEFDLAKVPSKDVSSSYNIFIGTRGQDVTLNGNVTFTLTLNGAGEPATLKIDNINYQTQVPVDAGGNPDPRDYDSSHNKINLWNTSAPGAIFEINGIKKSDVTPDDNGVYTYTINEATTKVWDAQFRKNISQTEENSSNVNVSLFDEFFYDITFKIKAEEPNNAHDGHLSVKIEGSATGNRNIDGGEFIVEELHGEFKDDGYYTYRLMNIPGKDVRGAILVVDYSMAAVGTKITISDVNIWEHENLHIPALIDGDVYIKDADELQGLAMAIANEVEPAYAKANVYLTADVNTNDITNHSKYIGIGTDTKPFTGTFKSVNVTWDSNGNLEKDANGNVIRTDAQHSVTLTSTETGVFNYVSGATIEGVNVKGTINATTNDVGALVNNSTGNTTIVNCDNAASVTSTGDNVGGLVGKVENNNTTPNTLTIRNVVNRGNITANEKVGGIIGRVDDSNITLINVLNEATITAESTSTVSANAAGLVGCQAGDNTDNKIGGDKKTTVIVINSGNAGDINGKNESAAFFGYMASRKTDTKFTNCYNSGTITGQDGNNNLVRIHEASPLNPTRNDVDGKTKIMDNVYDASAPAGTTKAPTDEQKSQGWVAKDDAVRTPWTQNDVLDCTLLGVVNGVDVSSYDALPWVQTVAADPHPVFVASAPVTITANVQDITNTTAFIHIAPIAIDGLPITLMYDWLKPEAPTKNGEGVENPSVKETHYHTIIAKAGEHIYTPVMNLENFADQTVHVMVGNTEVAGPINFTTLDHQKGTDIPAEARGELMKNDASKGTLRPIVDFEPEWKGFKDVENYNANVTTGVYSYTMPNATTERWQAQFRIPIGSENDKVVSLSPNYDYDVELTINSSKPANLIFKLESSETGWRNKDGETSIITNDHGTLTVEEIGEDGYVYQIKNLKGQYLPGAILVVDLSQAEANTNVTISKISVIEKARTPEGTVVDANKNSGLLTGSKNTVTNHSVALDMKGYDKEGETFVDGKEVIYTITTNVGTAETPIIKSWTTTGIGGQLSTYVVSGLDKNTTYIFNIKAQLEDGNIVGPTEGKNVEATTLNSENDTTPPSALTLNAGVAQTTKKTATLYMNAANGTSETITYRIYEGASTSVADAETKTLLATTFGTAGKNTTYTMRDLIPNTEYVYTIVAEDQHGQKAFQVVRPRTTCDTDPVDYENTVDGTAKDVWLNGQAERNRNDVGYVYKYKLSINGGKLVLNGALDPAAGSSENVANAVGIVMPHVYIIRELSETDNQMYTNSDSQPNQGKPGEFTYTTNGDFNAGDVFTLNLRYEYNGTNGESFFVTAVQRFKVIGSEVYLYFDERAKDLAVTDDNNCNGSKYYTGTAARIYTYRPMSRCIAGTEDRMWNTLALPYAMSIEQIRSKFGDSTELRTMTKVYKRATDVYNIGYGLATGIQEGMTYLLMVGNDVTDYKLTKDENSGVSIPVDTRETNGTTKSNEDGATFTFKSQYEKASVPGEIFVISNNKIYHVSEGKSASMNAFRGYIRFDGFPNSSKRSIDLTYSIEDESDEGVSDDINDFDIKTSDEPVFSIGGQNLGKNVRSLGKGLYIINGKKVVIK